MRKEEKFYPGEEFDLLALCTSEGYDYDPLKDDKDVFWFLTNRSAPFVGSRRICPEDERIERDAPVLVHVYDVTYRDRGRVRGGIEFFLPSYTYHHNPKPAGKAIVFGDFDDRDAEGIAEGYLQVYSAFLNGKRYGVTLWNNLGEMIDEKHDVIDLSYDNLYKLFYISADCNLEVQFTRKEELK